MNIIEFILLYNELEAIDSMCKNLSEKQKAEILSKIPEVEQKQIKVSLIKLRNCLQEYIAEPE